MFEFMGIIHNGGKLEERVFPIVMADADIFKEINRKKYDKYWKDEILGLKTGLSEMESTELDTRLDAIKKYEKILKSIPVLMAFLEQRNSLTVQKLQGENFSSLFKSIDLKTQQDLSI